MGRWVRVAMGMRLMRVLGNECIKRCERIKVGKKPLREGIYRQEVTYRQARMGKMPLRDDVYGQESRI